MVKNLVRGLKASFSQLNTTISGFFVCLDLIWRAIHIKDDLEQGSKEENDILLF